jgi:hypothetical protein
VGLIPDGVIGAMRATTEATMRDRCVITRTSTATRTFNPSTGDYTDPAPTVVYEGPCRLRHEGAGRGSTESAGAYVALRQYGATLPHTANGVREGDVLTLTVTDDGFLLDRPLYVLAVLGAAENVHRRLVLEDRQ